MNDRCWVRAKWGQGQDLAAALGDCNAALRLDPHNPNILGSRALVLLRQNQLDTAIADYDAALKQKPKLAWNLYARSLARRRKGQIAQADADNAAALAIDPGVTEQARRYGLTP